jgi:hypothetical protein
MGLFKMDYRIKSDNDGGIKSDNDGGVKSDNDGRIKSTMMGSCDMSMRHFRHTPT